MSIITTNMAKAREVHKTKIRGARIDKLAALDVEFQKALETSADTTSIVSKKKALRDAPANTSIEAAKTEAELKSQEEAEFEAELQKEEADKMRPAASGATTLKKKE